MSPMAFLGYLREQGYTRFEATQEAEDEWLEHVKQGYDGALLSKTKSWFTGYNSNVDGHDKLRYMIYLNGAPKYRERLAEIARRGYEGMTLT